MQPFPTKPPIRQVIKKRGDAPTIVSLIPFGASNHGLDEIDNDEETPQISEVYCNVILILLVFMLLALFLFKVECVLTETPTH
ncbi:hypothetical protein GCK72_022969 [Caenorhabditis remanei]|uniref:Uncharacterized protein n=1 Tax=Caenorhabditis remanei TaxID=31234 RepID=E3N8F5_CAERE|nr:hypothetical protein GCK72_022969 [Caenorhabditis remanei]EFO89455.1 hypothetical protein CRE_19967 [Caenorhabditis remanei]KAF1746513.1 hypothetical protein GCK72_022969 [Caenorhabditis remanei]